MWQNIERATMAPPRLARNDAFDIIAYFAAAGYFEQPGDAKRGARTYVRQGCARCHALQGPSTGGFAGPAVAQWSFAGDTVELFHAMWRHAPIMKAALDNRNMTWPSLSGQEMADILAWVGPQMRNGAGKGKPPELAIGDPDKGREIFAMKQCVVCHAGKRTLEDLPYEHTLTELAAVLWNHAPMMMALPPSLNRQELADIVAYLWTTRYFEEPGSVAKGRSLFETKRCVVCHSSFAAGVDFDAAAFIAAMWKHGPDVLAKARGLGIEWPAFANREMADLIAFANSIRRPAVVK
jgi:mono/diheme cytochrome c family protein